MKKGTNNQSSERSLKHARIVTIISQTRADNEVIWSVRIVFSSKEMFEIPHS